MSVIAGHVLVEHRPEGEVRGLTEDPSVEADDRAAKKKRATLPEEVERVRLQVSRSIKNDVPVIVGPFTGEVGFELLYWIPMIRWMQHEFPALRGRLSSCRGAGSAAG